MSSKDETVSRDIEAVTGSSDELFDRIALNIHRQRASLGRTTSYDDAAEAASYDALLRNSSAWHVGWGESMDFTKVYAPRTRRQRIADWWEFTVLENWNEQRVRLARTVRRLADWIDPYGY